MTVQQTDSYIDYKYINRYLPHSITFQVKNNKEQKDPHETA